MMGKYDFPLDLNTNNSLKLIVDRIKDDSCILEFGPANGRLTKYLHNEKNCTVDIVEYDLESGLDASVFARNALLGPQKGDITNFYWEDYLKSNKYDYIIFADVLEHLVNPKEVLERSKLFLKKEGIILVSIPNLAHNSIILNLLRDEFLYTQTGILDKTHLRFFTYKTLKRMFEEVGLKTKYEDAVILDVGKNEIDIMYDDFKNYNLDVIKNRGLGTVYQFIFELVDNNNECEIIDKIQPLIENEARNLHSLSSRLDILLKENLRLKEELSSCNEKIVELRSLEGIFQDNNEKIHCLEQELKLCREYKDMYNTISNSTIWRVTKPIRILLDFCKKICRKNRFLFLIYKGLASLKNEGLRITIERVRKYFEGEQYQPLALNSLDNIRIEDVTDLEHFISNVKSCVDKIVLPKVLSGYKGKNIVALISHEGSLTGAPVVIFHLAKFLKEKGYSPILFVPKEGKVIDEFTREGIPTIVYSNLYKDNFILHIRKLFDFVVANTIVSAPIINQLLYTNTPVVWWIHEAMESYKGHLNSMPKSLSDNIFVYTGGDYAKRILLQKRPTYSPETLLYYVPDLLGNSLKNEVKQGQYTFACIGTIEERKCQHILANAIDLMNPELREKCRFVFVGRSYYKPISEVIQNVANKYPDNVEHIEELTQSELKKLYQEIDCLVCPSIDDPMPVVITECLCLSKQVICYANGVGTAEILKKMNAGVLYSENTPRVLSKVLENTITNELNHLQLVNSRNVYEKYFSREAFDNGIEKMLLRIEEFSKRKNNIAVSVIIPSYNAGDDFKVLLPLLRNQVDIDNLEIVVVDSGSKDDTIKICKEYDVKLVEITQEEFSHSYSRNLGARKANNQVLVFMTQDARPTSNEWLSSFVKPLYNDGVAAVCCKEQCPDGTDFYYKICSKLHSSFMMMDNSDRIADISNCENEVDLRKNGNLNDIANAVRKDIFDKFQYRFDYAEDLDLGIRLLQHDYRIAFLSSVKVLHGHNRSADYYLKRIIVETLALDKIFNKKLICVESDFSDAITAYVVLYNADVQIKNTNNSSKLVLLDKYSDLLRCVSDGMIKEFFEGEEKGFHCEQIDMIMRLLYKEERVQKIDISMLEHLAYFYKNYVYDDALKDDGCSIEVVSDAMKKRFASFLGAKLAHVSVNSNLYSAVKNLTNGV